MSLLRQTAFRLSDEDLHVLDLVAVRYALGSRVAALRWLLHRWMREVAA